MSSAPSPAASPRPSGAQRVNAPSIVAAADISAKAASASGEKRRSATILWDFMRCALCETSAAFELDPDDTLVCTECGAVIEKHETNKKPFRLPQLLQTAEGTCDESMLQPQPADAASTSPILSAAFLPERLR